MINRRILGFVVLFCALFGQKLSCMSDFDFVSGFTPVNGGVYTGSMIGGYDLVIAAVAQVYMREIKEFYSKFSSFSPEPGTAGYNEYRARLKRIEGLKKELDRLHGNTFWGILLRSVGIKNGCGISGIAAVLAGMCVLKPLIGIVNRAIESTLQERVAIIFGKIFGGVRFKISNVAQHCHKVFSQAREFSRYTSAMLVHSVGRAMNARNREGGVVEVHDAKVESQDDQICSICNKSGGVIEYFFECRDPIAQHGIHSECAKSWFAKSPKESLNCPVCKGIRKFSFMQPDPDMSSLIGRLNIKSLLAGQIVSLKSAQKEVVALLKRLDGEDRNLERSLLIAIYADLEDVCKLFEKIDSFKDLCNQDILDKISIFATKGANNCELLNSWVSGGVSKSLEKFGGGAHQSYMGNDASSCMGSGLGFVS